MCMRSFVFVLLVYSFELYTIFIAVHLKIMRPFICRTVTADRNKNCLFSLSFGWPLLPMNIVYCINSIAFYAIHLSLPPLISSENLKIRQFDRFRHKWSNWPFCLVRRGNGDMTLLIAKMTRNLTRHRTATYEAITSTPIDNNSR